MPQLFSIEAFVQTHGNFRFICNDCLRPSGFLQPLSVTCMVGYILYLTCHPQFPDSQMPQFFYVEAFVQTHGNFRFICNDCLRPSGFLQPLSVAVGWKVYKCNLPFTDKFFKTTFGMATNLFHLNRNFLTHKYPSFST